MVRLSDRRGHRIDLGDEVEVDFWCRRFGCTRVELFAAAKKVGSMRDDVRTYLEHQKTRTGSGDE